MTLDGEPLDGKELDCDTHEFECYFPFDRRDPPLPFTCWVDPVDGSRPPAVMTPHEAWDDFEEFHLDELPAGKYRVRLFRTGQPPVGAPYEQATFEILAGGRVIHGAALPSKTSHQVPAPARCDGASPADRAVPAIASAGPTAPDIIRAPGWGWGGTGRGTSKLSDLSCTTCRGCGPS